MGMTIDEAINGVEKRILPIFDNDADHQALVTAIDTMRKYQKIEKIVNADLEEYHPLDRDPYRLALIKKVIEDGKS